MFYQKNLLFFKVLIKYVIRLCLIISVEPHSYLFYTYLSFDVERFQSAKSKLQGFKNSAFKYK